jgi:hypothetical protein
VGPFEAYATHGGVSTSISGHVRLTTGLLNTRHLVTGAHTVIDGQNPSLRC